MTFKKHANLKTKANTKYKKQLEPVPVLCIFPNQTMRSIVTSQFHMPHLP